MAEAAVSAAFTALTKEPTGATEKRKGLFEVVVSERSRPHGWGGTVESYTVGACG